MDYYADGEEEFEEFGDGCNIDHTSIGDYPHVDLSVKRDKPVLIGDIVKATCDKWYQEDQHKALLREQAHRDSVELDVKIVTWMMAFRRKLFLFCFTFTAIVLLISVPYISGKVYRLFYPLEAPVVPIETPVQHPDVIIASHKVIYPASRKESKRPAAKKAFSYDCPVPEEDERPLGFWEKAFKK